jgi:hypothetical protein
MLILVNTSGDIKKAFIHSSEFNTIRFLFANVR